MQSNKDTDTELAPINRIRVETALPRFPIHRLAKHGDVTINIKEQSGDGETLIRWEISHNSKYGQPGPLAYKLDTLIVNRRIEEASRPIPKIIRLGSLREIAEELGFTTHDTNTIKNALYQNAFAAITAKIRYRQSNGKERSVEIGDTRYGVVFTGETLPDGRAADAVYIVLHDFYREILDNALTRPLDYDYLRDLAPAAQRLYELLSYQIYAALKHDRPRAKLTYSEFCSHAPQTRYIEFDKVKKQMYKIHHVHVKSGYIAKVNFDQTTDAEGQPDWIMLYMPGLKARAEYQTFTGRTGALPPQLGQTPTTHESSKQQQLALKLTPLRRSRAKPQPTPSPLVAELVQRGVTEAMAAELVEQYPERIQTQIEILDGLPKKKLDKIDDPAAYLVAAIRHGHATPKGHISKVERERQVEAKRQMDVSAAEESRRKAAAEAADRRIADQVKGFRKTCLPDRLAQLQADAIAQASEESRQSLDNPAMKRFRETMLFVLVRDHIAQLIKSGQLEPEST